MGLPERVRIVAAPDGWPLAVTEVDLPDRALDPDVPPVLLVHGFAQNRRAFLAGPLPRLLLQRGARVFLGELRGHGRSAQPGLKRDWTVAALVDHDLPTLIAHVQDVSKKPSIHYMGHSMGGVLAYAHLATKPPFASLTGWAAPLWLGADRKITQLAALLVPPAMSAARVPRVPMDWFLGALSAPLGRPGMTRWFQRFAGISNPDRAEQGALEGVLKASDPESRRVFRPMSRLALTRNPVVHGVDILATVRGWPGPIAAVAGEEDVFAGPRAMTPFRDDGHAGPRRVFDVRGARHVDVLVGHHLGHLFDPLWRFLNPQNA